MLDELYITGHVKHCTDIVAHVQSLWYYGDVNTWITSQSAGVDESGTWPSAVLLGSPTI